MKEARTATIFSFLSAFFLFALLVNNFALASGNHPEAGICTKTEPYYAICTHSLHNLDGWFGSQCYTDKQSAQQEAEKHAKKYHQGNMRWTGISQRR